MAEGKKSVIIYCDWQTTFEELTDDEAGRLIKHFFRYVNDKNPEAPDKLTKIAFEPIKQQLKRDLEKWDSIKEARRSSGAKGGTKSGESRRKQNEANEANASNLKQNEANEAVTVTVNVNDTVIVNDNVIKNISIDDRSKLIDDILLFFCFKPGDPKSIPHQREINRFLTEIIKEGLYDVFTDQYHNFKKVKAENHKFNYSLKNFLFSDSGYAAGGQWNAFDWSLKIKELKTSDLVPEGAKSRIEEIKQMIKRNETKL